MSDHNGEWVAGMYLQAYRFGVAGETELRADPNPLLDVAHVTMMAWVRPLHYDTQGSKGIIMNHEASYEMGLVDGTGALQAAFAPGCWRWWGNIRVPLHEWVRHNQLLIHVACIASKLAVDRPTSRFRTTAPRSSTSCRAFIWRTPLAPEAT